LHTEKTTPPRALWVPFELGRPLGAPNNVEFQKEVLLGALELLERNDTPIVVDFGKEAPQSNGDAGPLSLSCPVNFAKVRDDLNETEKLMAAVREEIGGLQTWYDLAKKNRGRSTVGVSKLDNLQICDLIENILYGKTPESPRPDIELAYALNLAVDDLKAYYFEAITAQPGQESTTSHTLREWFWKQTAASKALFALRVQCMKSEDPLLQRVGKRVLIPAEYIADGS
jgi:hypothetical protein